MKEPSIKVSVYTHNKCLFPFFPCCITNLKKLIKFLATYLSWLSLAIFKRASKYAWKTELKLKGKLELYEDKTF